MTADQFITLQNYLWEAFGPAVQWWLIIFLVAGIGVITLLAFLYFVRGWMD